MPTNDQRIRGDLIKLRNLLRKTANEADELLMKLEHRQVVAEKLGKLVERMEQLTGR